MVFVCRQRRILRIVAFIGVACVIFLCFQLFLVGFLDHDAHLVLRRGARPKFGPGSDELRAVDGHDGRRLTITTPYPLRLQQKLESECSSRNCSDAANLLTAKRHVVLQSRLVSRAVMPPSRRSVHSSHKDSHVEISQFESVWELLEHKFSQPDVLEKNISESHSTRGVHRRWQYLYNADEHMQFTCILSQVYV